MGARGCASIFSIFQFTPKSFHHCTFTKQSTHAFRVFHYTLSHHHFHGSRKPKKVGLGGGKGDPGSARWPALGAKGVNIAAFCKDYNARTADKAGCVIPVEITVYDDRSFTFILKTPPASVLLLKAAGMRISN